MNKTLVALLVLVAVSAAFDFKTFSSEMEKKINSKKTTWTAGYNQHFEGWNYDQIRNLMGSLEPTAEQKLQEKWEAINVQLPNSYDLREAYPQCQSIQEVRDQSNCGSCWAFGTVEAISDRLCIVSGQKEQTRISSENLLSCCATCGFGCNGGNTSSAWSYFVKTGLVTGDLYTDEEMNSPDYCQPYAFQPCSHHVTGEYVPCDDLPTFPTPSCENSCNSEYKKNTYEKDITKGVKSYSVPRKEEQIQNEIYTNGSVTVSFTVYEDFLTYSGGVYQHESGKSLGGHAVKMIGWGTENGTPYWLCTNSWNNSWGENGFFKILRGVNECGIENNVVAGYVDGQNSNQQENIIFM